MSSSKNSGGRKKHLALVVFRNQTVSRTTATLRTYETLPPLTQKNADRAKIKMARRGDVPDEVIDKQYKGRNAEQAARAAAEAAGCAVVTYQQITFEANRAEG